MSFKSVIFVSIQFACIGLLMLTGTFIYLKSVFLTVEILGVILGFWAILAVGPKHLSAFPEVNARSVLRTNGPYRLIRHPMYSSVLLVTLAWAANSLSMFRSIAWIILLIDLLLKLSHEERLLAMSFPEYVSYQAKTARLLPFIY